MYAWLINLGIVALCAGAAFLASEFADTDRLVIFWTLINFAVCIVALGAFANRGLIKPREQYWGYDFESFTDYAGATFGEWSYADPRTEKFGPGVWAFLFFNFLVTGGYFYGAITNTVGPTMMAAGIQGIATLVYIILYHVEDQTVGGYGMYMFFAYLWMIIAMRIAYKYLVVN